MESNRKFTEQDLVVGASFTDEVAGPEWHIRILQRRGYTLTVEWGDGEILENDVSNILDTFLNAYPYKLDKSGSFASLYNKLSS